MTEIKMEPDVGGYMDDEFYEDTGELQLPPRDASNNVWLTRIPEWLYESISKWEALGEGPDDEQVQIGEVLAFRDPGQPGTSTTKPMRVFFNERWQKHFELPNAFELGVTPTPENVLGNTYIFTEKDLPGFKANNLGSRNQSSLTGGAGAVQDPNARVQKRSKYKKAIPKQTALVGSATRQYNATPLSTPEYVAFRSARNTQAIQGAYRKTNLRDDLNVDNERAQKAFRSFIRPPVAKKAQVNKAARIPKNELIDLLHSLFDQYAYWPMKAIKKETKQPEAYLKEVLGDIAQLVRGGPFASTWKRHPMFEKNVAGQKQEMAPEVSGDEDEEEMEDVI